MEKLEEPAKGDAHQVSLKHLVELEKLGSGAFSVVSAAHVIRPHLSDKYEGIQKIFIL